jgi:limonene-1,2-epoxide hydrolase
MSKGAYRCTRRALLPVAALLGASGCSGVPTSSRDTGVRDVVDEFVRAYRAVDPERMSRVLAEDVQFEDPTFRLRHSSRADVVKMMEQAREAFTEVDYEVRERILCAPHAVLQAAFIGRPRAKSGEASERFAIRGATILRIEDGLIRSWTDYYDFRTFAERMQLRVCRAAAASNG